MNRWHRAEPVRGDGPLRHWHRAEPVLAGRRAIVTGANTGLGYQTARGLALRGAEVTLAVRRTDAGEAAAERIRNESADASVRVEPLDLGALASVAAFADRWSGPLDLLVNNAGQMLVPTRKTTTDGFERHMGVNHLGHFALTALLWPSISEDGRVISVSSLAHRATRRLDRALGEGDRYVPMVAYGQSKLAQLLFTAELNRRLPAGDRRLVVAAHPGWCATAEEPSPRREPLPVKVSRKATALLGTRPDHGVRPQLFAATAAEVRSGEFYGPRLAIGGRPHRARASAAARNPEDAAWLWSASERLTGIPFPI